MYPYKKENLIPYKEIFVGAAVMFVAFFLAAIYTKKPLGLNFGFGFLVLAVVGPGGALFRWHSEPTAKRQLVTAIVVLVVVGVLGAIALDFVAELYHLGRGECPVYLDFSGRCEPQ